jgi:Anti-sigma-K factor rskA, C-terminal
MQSVERSELESANSQSGSAFGSPAGGAAGAPAQPFWRRVAFWRALAGMGFTLALGALIVAAEFSSTLIHRTHSMTRRIARLNAETKRLKSRVSAADQKLAAMRAAAADDAALKRILVAPDLRLIKLTPSGPAPGAAGASAVIAISDASKSAILQTSGLAPSPDGRVYRLWWLPRRGAPVAAGQFPAAAGGAATVSVAPPPKGAVAAVIFAQEASAPSAPVGAPLLRSAPIR